MIGYQALFILIKLYIYQCVRVAIGNVHILYSKMRIDQMPNFKTVIWRDVTEP